jgi:hypothetical protein
MKTKSSALVASSAMLSFACSGSPPANALPAGTAPATVVVPVEASSEPTAPPPRPGPIDVPDAGSVTSANPPPASSAPAPAAPPGWATAMARAKRWATKERLCWLIARSERPIDEQTCLTDPPVLDHWEPNLEEHGVQFVLGSESGRERFWMFVIGVDASGAIVSSRALFSRGGP